MNFMVYQLDTQNGHLDTALLFCFFLYIDFFAKQVQIFRNGVKRLIYDGLEWIGLLWPAAGGNFLQNTVRNQFFRVSESDFMEFYI